MDISLLWLHELPRYLPARIGQDDNCIACDWYVLNILRDIPLTGLTENEHGAIFQPVFISVDPARDSPSRIGKYLKDFHSSFVGLVGPYEEIKAICKAYRVYFSTPPNADPAGDYLVDHSIFVYLMDPEGKFVEAFGQSVGPEEIVKKVREALGEWNNGQV